MCVCERENKPVSTELYQYQIMPTNMSCLCVECVLLGQVCGCMCLWNTWHTMRLCSFPGPFRRHLFIYFSMKLWHRHDSYFMSFSLSNLCVRVCVLSALSIPYLTWVTLHNVPAETLYNNANAQYQMSERKVTTLLWTSAHLKLSEPDFTLMLPDVIWFIEPFGLCLPNPCQCLQMRKNGVRTFF